MPGIALDTIADFQNRVITFNAGYIHDWNHWLGVTGLRRPIQLGVILRRWQACRPNRMRREAAALLHPPPYLEDLATAAAPHIAALATFDIANIHALGNPAYVAALHQLWAIFEQLSYHGKARGGLAGSVGISKAVMLLTDGRVGPAFDSEVRNALGLAPIVNAADWLAALGAVSNDIQAFEHAQHVFFTGAVPVAFRHLHNGRIYDMALGPR